MHSLCDALVLFHFLCFWFPFGLSFPFRFTYDFCLGCGFGFPLGFAFCFRFGCGFFFGLGSFFAEKNTVVELPSSLIFSLVPESSVETVQFRFDILRFLSAFSVDLSTKSFIITFTRVFSHNLFIGQLKSGGAVTPPLIIMIFLLFPRGKVRPPPS